MKTYTKQLLKTSIALILALLMIVGTTATGFAAIVDDKAETGSAPWNNWHVAGSFNSWSTGDSTKISMGTNYGWYKVDNLTANTDYTMKMYQYDNGDRWCGVNTSWGDTSPLNPPAGTNFRKNASTSATLHTGAAGTYTFRVSDSWYNDNNDLGTYCYVYPALEASIASNKATVKGGGTATITPTVSGGFSASSDGSTSHSYSATAGSITSGGVFTAPQVSSNTTVTITDVVTSSHSDAPSSFELTKTVTTTITVQPNTYTVSYAAGSTGASGSQASQTKTYGVSLTLADKGGFSKAGYTQTGWSTSSSGSGGTAYALKGSYTNNAAVTLYPVFSANSFNVTAGTCTNGKVTVTTSPATTITGTTVTATPNDHYHFVSWDTNANGTFNSTSQNPATFKPTADATVTASFAIDTHSISFNANGGSGTQSGTTKNYGSSYTLPSCTFNAPTNKEFDHWALGSASGTSYNAGSSYTVTGDTVFYAVWKNAGSCVLSFDNPTTSGDINARVTNTATTNQYHAGGTITYTSSNTNVATVNSTTGQVTGRQSGTTIITATCSDPNSTSASYTYTVNEPVFTITYGSGGQERAPGREQTISFTAYNHAGGSSFSDTDTSDWTFEEDDNTIVEYYHKESETSQRKGTVLYKSPGTTSVYATCVINGKRYTSQKAEVTTFDPLISLSLTNNEICIGGTSTASIVDNGPDSYHKCSGGKYSSYSSNNTSVATISGSTVTGKADGTATISRTYSITASGESTPYFTKTVSATIRVNKPTIHNKDTVYTNQTLVIGGTYTIPTATVDNDSTPATAPTYTKDSSDAISKNGMVLTAVKPGTSTITVALGSYDSKTFTVTVSQPTLTFANATLTKEAGETFTQTVTSSGPAASSIVYSVTSGSDIASVNSSTGEVKTTGVGSATIKATATYPGGYTKDASYTVTTSTKYFLAGDFTNPTWGDGKLALVMTGTDEYSVTVNFANTSTKKFKIIDDGTWLGNNGTMDSGNCTGWSFTRSGGDCGITPSVAGNYIFTFNTSTKKVSVTYPRSYRATGNVTVINSTRTGSATINGSASPAQVPSGDDAVFVASAPSSSSQTFTFLGWYDGDGTLVSSNESYTVENISADITLTAKYVRDLYICGTMASGWIGQDTPATKMTYHAADNDNPTGYYTYECTNFAADTNDQYRLTGKNDAYTEVKVYEYPGTAEGATVTQSGDNVKVALNAGYSQPITIRAKYTSGNNDYFELKTIATQNAAKSVTFNIPSGETITNVSINNQSGTSASVIVGVPVTVSFDTTSDKWVEAVTSTGIQASDITVTPNGTSNTVTATFTMPNDNVTITPTMIQLTKIGYKLYTNSALGTDGYENGTIQLSSNKTKVITGEGTFYKTGAEVVFTAKWAANYSFDGFYNSSDNGQFLPANKLTDADVENGKTFTYTITGSETDNYYSVEVNMYRNIYWNKTEWTNDGSKHRFSYNPQTKKYTATLDGITTNTTNDDNVYYLSLNGNHSENINLGSQAGDIKPEGGHATGISTWAGADSQNKGKCILFGLVAGYDVPATITLEATSNGEYELNIDAIQKTQSAVTVNTVTGISSSGAGQYYTNDDVTVSFVMTEANAYLDWANTTITGIDKSDCNYDATTNVITFKMPANNVTINPAKENKYKVTGEVKLRDWTTEQSTVATISISNLTQDGYWKQGCGTPVVYSYTFNGDMGTRYEFYGWFADPNCTQLKSTENTLSISSINKDTTYYALFVRKVYVHVYGTNVLDWPTEEEHKHENQLMKYDINKNVYYYDGITYDGIAESGEDNAFRFKFYDTSSDLGAYTCWTGGSVQPAMCDGVDVTREISNTAKCAYFTVSNNSYTHEGYSAPLTVYFDLYNRANDVPTIYAKATNEGATIYLSSGLDMNNASQSVSNFSRSVYADYPSEYDQDGITVGQEAAVYNRGDEKPVKVTEYVTKMTQVRAQDVKVQTTIDAAYMSSFEVAAFVYYSVEDGRAYHVDATETSFGSGVYEATIPVKGTMYIAPSFQAKDATETIVVNKSALGTNSEWGPLVACYIFNGSHSGLWPGQLMIPDSTGNCFSMKVKTDTGAKVTFSNYLQYTAFVNDTNGSANKLGLNKKSIKQTYDYNEYSILVANSDINEVEFRIKENEDGYHGDDYMGSQRTTQWTIVDGSGNPKSQINLGDYSFKPLYRYDGVTPLSLNLRDASGSAKFYIISEGDVYDKDTATNIGEWAVRWHVYDQAGKHVTTVWSKDLFDKESGHEESKLIDAIVDAGYTYNDEVVMISYDKANGAVRQGSTHNVAYDGQWTGIYQDVTYPIHMKIGVRTPATDSIGSLTDNSNSNPVGSVQMVYSGYQPTTGSNVPAWQGKFATANVCRGNKEFTGAATEGDTYAFYGYYVVDDADTGSYTLISQDPNFTFEASQETTYVAVFQHNSTGIYRYTYEGRFFNPENPVYQQYDRKVLLSDDEIKGYAGNGNHANTPSYLFKYKTTSGSTYWADSAKDPSDTVIADPVIENAPTAKEVDVYLKNTTFARTDGKFTLDGTIPTLRATQTPLTYTVKCYGKKEGSDTYQLLQSLTAENNSEINATETPATLNGAKFSYWSNDEEGAKVISVNRLCKVIATPMFNDNSDGKSISLYAIYGSAKPQETLTWDTPVINTVVKSRQKTTDKDILQLDTYGLISNNQALAIKKIIDDIQNHDSEKYGIENIEFGVAYVYNVADKYRSDNPNPAYPATEKGAGLNTNVTTMVTKAINSSSHTAFQSSGNWRYACVGYSSADGKNPPENNITNFNRFDLAMQWNNYDDVKDYTFSVYLYFKVDDNDPVIVYQGVDDLVNHGNGIFKVD